MDKEKFFCEYCKKTINLYNKSRHEKSQGHLKKLDKECRICYETSKIFKNCISCPQKWCNNCDEKLAKCPFCRSIIEGRNEREEKNIHEILDWYFTNDSKDINNMINEVVDNIVDRFMGYISDIKENGENQSEQKVHTYILPSSITQEIFDTIQDRTQDMISTRTRTDIDIQSSDTNFGLNTILNTNVDSRELISSLMGSIDSVVNSSSSSTLSTVSLFSFIWIV